MICDDFTVAFAGTKDNMQLMPEICIQKVNEKSIYMLPLMMRFCGKHGILMKDDQTQNKFVCFFVANKTETKETKNIN